MKGILKTADNLVIAAGFAVSGAQRARQTLTWLASHGYKDLARNAIVVVTDKENVSERVDKSLIRSNLRGMCRGLVVVPLTSQSSMVTKSILRCSTPAPGRPTWRSPRPSLTVTSKPSRGTRSIASGLNDQGGDISNLK